MMHKVNWNVDPEDVGCNEYSDYKVISINTNETENGKEIWSVEYTYTWDCGDGCCSDTLSDIAYIGSMSKYLRERLLEKLPDHKLQEVDI